MQDLNRDPLTPDNALEYLSIIAACLATEHQAIVNVIFLDPNFAIAPGGVSHHHNYMGGLAQHTAEVVRNCIHLMGMELDEVPGERTFLSANYTPMRYEHVLMAALLHDYCKTVEYGWELETVADPAYTPVADELPAPVIQRFKEGSIKRLAYGSLIGHVVGSALIFQMNAMLAGLPLDTIMSVTHIMLAHHGRHEWRSPVEPMTPEAWILHSADMLSARTLPSA